MSCYNLSENPEFINILNDTKEKKETDEKEKETPNKYINVTNFSTKSNEKYNIPSSLIIRYIDPIIILKNIRSSYLFMLSRK